MTSRLPRVMLGNRAILLGKEDVIVKFSNWYDNLNSIGLCMGL